MMQVDEVIQILPFRDSLIVFARRGAQLPIYRVFEGSMGLMVELVHEDHPGYLRAEVLHDRIVLITASGPEVLNV